MNFGLSERVPDDAGETPLRALPWIDGDTGGCRCEPAFREPVGTGVEDRVVLDVDADDCRGRGALAASSDCLATVVTALTDRDADVIRTRHHGRERSYAGPAADLLVAAGQFRERIGFHEERLAERVVRDPFGAAREACGRAGPAKRIAAETGLLSAVEELAGGAGEVAGGHGDPGDSDGDLGGVLGAYDGLQMHYKENGKPGKIKGFTPEQRFFMSWATIWRTKIRDEALRTQIQTDPHSPGQVRGYAPLQHVDAFYKAFDLQPKHDLYLRPDKRVRIW